MKKYFSPAISLVLMSIIIYFLGRAHWHIINILSEGQMQESLSLFSPYAIAILKMTLLGIIFGIFMDWKGLDAIYKHRRVKLNLILIPALITMAIALIPSYFWYVWFSMNSSGLYGFTNALGTDEVHLLVSVLSGFLLVQSLTPENEI